MAASDHYYDTYIPNHFVDENVFRRMPAEAAPAPAFDQARSDLPDPYWDGHESAVACYWKAWEIAFRNLRRPAADSGFVANFVDTAFNDCLFMWDSAFILLFARYGHRVFNFQRTLDNLYSRQHPDGFICREIGVADGQDRFHRFDPTSTGPNVMPWTEWEHYHTTGDRERLGRVFPVLIAYHQWLRAYRTWPDGTYWSSGWSCGMDNQPRFPEGSGEHRHLEHHFYHGHLVWIDTCLQQILSAGLLLQMADVLDRRGEVADLEEERERLTRVVNDRLWDEDSAFYYDEQPGGELSGVKTIGAYWALLAGVAPPAGLARFVAHLEDPDEFKRPHRVPSLSAGHPDYDREGGYWRGGVWAPTNYMVLRGLTRAGYDALAHDIALNDLDNVISVFEQTGTVWENYAPESAAPGQPAKPDFVGWSGLPPIAHLFEYVFGLRADVLNARLVWDVRLTEQHGIRRYPFGSTGLLDLACDSRGSLQEKPRLQVSSTIPLELVLQWEGGVETLHVHGL